MDLSRLEEAFLPYEKRLCAQEELRRLLGVKEVDRPTYERYIIGPIQRFDRRKNAFMALQPDNPFGQEFRQRFKVRTGLSSRQPLSNSELEPEDRISQSLSMSAKRLCREYEPELRPVTPPEGRVEVTDRSRMSRLIKKAGLLFGAEIVRITRVDQRWVYQGLDIPHEYAVVVAVSHIPSLIKTAPSHLSGLAVSDSYSRLKYITTQLADFIRGMGYDAAFRETRAPNMEMLLVPMAMDAGIGEFSRTGRVLSPEFGINMRLKAVTTDLPLEADKPISFNVHDFCMVCENCAAYCPANAIPFGPPTDKLPGIHNNPGFRKWYVDAERCLTFWLINRKKWTSCGGRCIAVCPWNKPRVHFHHLARWLAVHSTASIKKMLVRCDRLVYRRTKKIK